MQDKLIRSPYWQVAFCILLTLPCTARLVSAHDFWVQPSAYQAGPGVFSFRLFVGDHFHGRPFPRYGSLTERFVVSGPEGERPVLGLEGAEPAGVARLDQPGLHVVGYRSRHSFSRLGPEKFDRYLREQGLERIIETRAEVGETGKPVREAFSRCAKALVEVGPGAGGDDRVLGFRLELVAERNPYALGAGEKLPVRLLFEGKPLAGALVVFVNHDDPDKAQSFRTDLNGRVEGTISAGGLWMVKVVHMVRPAGNLDADWESLWASLTFERPGSPGQADSAAGLK